MKMSYSCPVCATPVIGEQTKNNEGCWIGRCSGCNTSVTYMKKSNMVYCYELKVYRAEDVKEIKEGIQ